MRPNWEKTLTRGVARLLGKPMGAPGAFSEPYVTREDYVRAAHVVRALDRQWNIGRYAYNLDDPGDSPEARVVLERLWTWSGQSGDKQGKVDADHVRTALRLYSDYSYRTSGPLELASVEALVGETAFIGEPVTTQDDSGWAGLGSLRNDLNATSAAETRDAVLAAFDTLSRDAMLQKRMVRVFQSWAITAGLYTGELDGIWGPKTELAFVRVVPAASGRPTSFAHLQAVSATVGDAVPFADLLGVGIARDKWITRHAGDVPAPSEEDVYVEPGSTEIVVTSPKPPVDSGATTATGVTVTSPKPPTGESAPTPTAEEATAQALLINLPPTVEVRQVAGSSPWLTVGLIGLGAVVVLGVVLTSKK